MSLKDTVPHILRDAAERFGSQKALWAPRRKPPVDMTFAEVATQVAQFGAGLIAKGISPGDKIALFSDNQPRWMMADLAVLGIGAIDVPRGSDTGTDEFSFILEHSGCVAAIVQDAKLYKRLEACPVFKALKLIIVLDGDLPDNPATTQPLQSYNDVLSAGEGREQEYDAALARLDSGSLATIVYTSGTTGSPKGVMLTHRNLATQPQYVELGTKPMPGELLMSVLPTWHAYERAAEYFGLSHGATILYSDKRYLKEDMQKHQPHLLPCVPRIWEAVYDAVQDKVRKSPPARQKLFRFFCKAGMAHMIATRAAVGREIRTSPRSAASRAANAAKAAALAPVRAAGEKLIFNNIRSVTGGRIRGAISGGGSLAPYLDDFFEMIGIPILNGYGLTETSPVLCIRRLNHNVRGSVGLPLEHTEVEIRGEGGSPVPPGTTGEIFVRGPQVMQGYYKNEQATAQVLAGDGWFRTGDLGFFSVTGDLVINGRAKDTIVLVSGENVEPEPIEDIARKSPLVSQIVIVGQDQKYVGALVVPTFSVLAETLGLPPATSPEELCRHPKAAKAVKDSIAAIVNADKRFKSSDQVARVTLLSDAFSEDNGTLTKTMKIKRNVVAKSHADIIADMFK